MKVYEIYNILTEKADIGKRIKVYWNLHKDLFSAQSREERDGKIGWYVDKDFYADEIFMSNVEFKVSEAGRQRVIRDKRKNVHSKIEGVRISESDFVINTGDMEKISVYYNPYKVDSFVDLDDHSRKLFSADYVHLETTQTAGGKRGKITAYLNTRV